MARDAAQEHIIDKLQTSVMHSLLNKHANVEFAPIDGKALKALQSEAVYKAYYDWLVEDVPLSAFNGYRDSVFTGQWKPHREPRQFSFFSTETNRLIHYLAFPTAGGFFSTLGFDSNSTVRNAGVCQKKKNGGQVVLGALVTDDADLVHCRQLIGQSWDGTSPIFTSAKHGPAGTEKDFYSAWSPSLLRTSTNCDTAYSGVFSNHVENRIGSVDTKDFMLNTIFLSWTARTSFDTSPATPGFVDVRIPCVLYNEDDPNSTINKEVHRRSALTIDDKE